MSRAEALRRSIAADREWLRDPAHRALFVEPTLRALDCTARPFPTSWSQYWADRGWRAHVDEKLRAVPGAHRPFFRHMSAMLTFPLTLAHIFSRPRFLANIAGGDSLTLAVVGARAEATLPPAAWQELALAFPNLPIHLHMVGPAVVEDRARFELTPTVSASLHQGFLHDVGSSLAVDAFVLFHPGLEHKGWERAWAPSLRLMFETKLPVVCTGFSNADSAANASAVVRAGEKMARDFDRPRIFANPFASLKLDVADPAERGSSAEASRAPDSHAASADADLSAARGEEDDCRCEIMQCNHSFLMV